MGRVPQGCPSPPDRVESEACGDPIASEEACPAVSQACWDLSLGRLLINPSPRPIRGLGTLFAAHVCPHSSVDLPVRGVASHSMKSAA